MLQNSQGCPKQPENQSWRFSVCRHSFTSCGNLSSVKQFQMWTIWLFSLFSGDSQKLWSKDYIIWGENPHLTVEQRAKEIPKIKTQDSKHLGNTDWKLRAVSGHVLVLPKDSELSFDVWTHKTVSSFLSTAQKNHYFSKKKKSHSHSGSSFTTAEFPYLLFELEVEFPHCFLSVPFNLFAPEKQTLRWKKNTKQNHETCGGITLNKLQQSAETSHYKHNYRAVRSHLFKLIITKEHTQQFGLRSQADQLIIQKDDATYSHWCSVEQKSLWTIHPFHKAKVSGTDSPVSLIHQELPINQTPNKTKQRNNSE